MKRWLFSIAWFCIAIDARCQGMISFRNVNGKDLQAYVNRSDDPSPLGRLGAGYWAQLYVGPAGTPEDSLTAVGDPVEFYDRQGVPTGSVGIGGIVVVPLLDPGTFVSVQMRAWKGSAGRTYEAARATGLDYGQSVVITLELGGYDPVLPPLPYGLQPFTVLVPEPPTASLGALAISVFALRFWTRPSRPSHGGRRR